MGHGIGVTFASVHFVVLVSTALGFGAALRHRQPKFALPNNALVLYFPRFSLPYCFRPLWGLRPYCAGCHAMGAFRAITMEKQFDV